MARIGVDQWVEESAERSVRYRGRYGALRQTFDRLPPWSKLAIFVVLSFLYPLIWSDGFLVRVGVNVLLLAMLAVGLNVVVGWAGLLDLGYVAFYGFGAYFYAILSSDHLGIHWPTWASIPVIVIASAALGLLLGLPSRRLVGDYLAIMTLFFSQIFLELVTNLDRLDFPGVSSDFNLTGGANGIPGVDRWDIFGLSIISFRDHYYLLLVLLVALVIGLYNLSNSRTGRAWMALREDTLAAQHMTMPVGALKLMAFALGAAVAGLSGTVFAAVQVGVFPANFEIVLLITMYAAVVLGGAGSIPGVILGAIAIAAVPEMLRSPNGARWLFYGALILVVLLKVRPWQKLLVVVGGVVAFGYAIRGIASAIWDEATTGVAAEGLLANQVDDWVLLPGSQTDLIASYAFIALVVATLVVVSTRGWGRATALIPTLYLGVFVWENKLVFQPSVTRQLLFGALLVFMMAARPHGLLGSRTVEVA